MSNLNAWVLVAIAGCGSGPAAIVPDASPDSPPPPTDLDRTAAATMTAQTNPLCTAIAPFYWELGGVDAMFASGTVGTSPPTATTTMPIASASKWLYGAYAVEKAGGPPDADDVPFLNFTSGYVGFKMDNCPAAGTIDDCLAQGTPAGSYGAQTPAAIGKFLYNGAHLQKHASLHGLGAMKDAELATEVRSMIGDEIDIQYADPQPAGGVVTSADQYALFLRKLLVGSPTPLLIGSMLANDSVCTNPNTCPTSLGSPIPGAKNTNESWHYGLAHWIEDDPMVGDGAFSSAGSLGFYPWVDQTRTLYGVLARRDDRGSGYDSAMCGRLIRKAWVTATPQ